MSVSDGSLATWHVSCHAKNKSIVASWTGIKRDKNCLALLLYWVFCSL